MDPFEVRMQFVTLLSRLTSSLPSIQKVSSFAFKHGPRCGDDLWDCLVEEVGQVSLNARINLLYFLDSLLDKQGPGQPYKELVKRDLGKVVEMVVPSTREGALNLMSVNQMLRSWKTRRLLDADLLDGVLNDLDKRRETFHSADADSSAFANFSRNDILRRIEDDRERHKRLRERIWVLPVPATLSSAPSSSHAPHHSALSSLKPSPESPASPSDFGPTSKGKSRAKGATTKAGNAVAPAPPIVAAPLQGPELAIAMEFDQLWEASEEEMNLSLGGEDEVVEEDIEIEEGEELEVPIGADGVPRGRRNSVGGWELEESDRVAMRRERERCFGRGR